MLLLAALQVRVAALHRNVEMLLCIAHCWTGWLVIRWYWNKNTSKLEQRGNPDPARVLDLHDCGRSHARLGQLRSGHRE